MVGPSGPPVSTTAKKGAVGKGTVGKGGSASPPRPPHDDGGGERGGGGVIGPSRGPLPRSFVDDARGEVAASSGGGVCVG